MPAPASCVIGVRGRVLFNILSLNFMNKEEGELVNKATSPWQLRRVKTGRKRWRRRPNRFGILKQCIETRRRRSSRLK